MMDKKISFFWGNERMSWLRYMTLWTFRQLNPNWEMRLFVCKQQRIEKYWDTPEQQDFFTYSGPDYCDRLQDVDRLKVIDWEIAEENLISLGPSHKSNFFKWGLMDEESGVYADMDIVFVRPIDNWFANIKDSDVAVCYQKTSTIKHHFSIGLLASSGIGGFYKDVYDECVKGFTDKVYQSAGVKVLLRMFSGNRWASMRDQYPDVQFANFEMDYIYPWDSSKIIAMTSKLHTEIPERTFGLHWYAGHPLSQKMNAYLCPESLDTYHSTITHYLKEVMSK